MTDSPSQSLILVADPMCSWCWGFAPVMRNIRDDFSGRLGIEVLMGGLRPGTTEAMDDTMKEYIRHHWEQVFEKTGQPFDFDFFKRDGFVYDTEIPCRAVVTMRQLNPDAVLDYLEHLHRANYAENRDITDAAVLADIAGKYGIEADAFSAFFASDEARAMTTKDFHQARDLGVTGFPSIVARQHMDDSDDQYAFLTMGYRGYQAIKPLLSEWSDAR
ncbi:MAG: DsbA family protein [Alphaproteobacteria bacterium]